MRTTALHPRFGVEIHGAQLADITADSGYAEVRQLFEAHSLLLFRKQDLDDQQHLEFGKLFGPIEDRSLGANGPDPVVSPVSNVDSADNVIDENDKHLLHLKANQLWHTDSTFLPVPALTNVLIARTVPSSGGETELVSTRAAWQDMPTDLRARARGKVFVHRYAHSRRKISEALATETMFTQWEDQAWQSLWTNPATGEEAIYIASHVCAVRGMNADDGRSLVDELVAFATRDEYIYRHHWTEGDVLVWDERATMHRGRPWPYDEARTLSSICVTASETDGLSSVRA